MENLSVKISKYKCFFDLVGFDKIKRVNIVIGRNNSGKSSLIDIVEMAITENGNIEGNTKLEISTLIDEKAIRKVFRENYSSAYVSSYHGNDLSYGMLLLGRRITWSEQPGSSNRVRNLIYIDYEGLNPPIESVPDLRDRLLSEVNMPLRGKKFRRLFAERDIKPELSSPHELSIAGNGQGLTNVIQSFINRSDLPSALVERKLLNGLNTIFSHDATFTDIVCQLHSTSNEWEVYLEEEDKGRVQLSKSGSGLKTVISVLSYLILLPHLEKSPLDNFVFCFEELENNIHPSLLRRLNEYIYQASRIHNFTYFITTHSNVLIDQFSKQTDAQIVHVCQKNGYSTCSVATTYLDNHGILDDLDVRASDILQANGIIWVEGPSDRIYVNRWIEIISNGELKEGTHYQVVFYGGRLLSHLSAHVDEQDGISILKANRNAAILIDSDKRYQSQGINGTKKRIIAEFKKIDSFCWLTKGKEIENYISPSLIQKAFGMTNDIPHVGPYENFFDYLETYLPNKGKLFEGKKTILASQLITYMTKDMLTGILDLNQNIIQLCDEIKKWNR